MSKYECLVSTYKSNMQFSINELINKKLKLQSSVDRLYECSFPIIDFKCFLCRYQTDSYSDYKKHLRILDQNKLRCFNHRIKCKSSQYVSSLTFRKSRLTRNKKINEKSVTFFNCSKCKYKMIYKSHLQKHNVDKHTAESEIKWHQCVLCYSNLKDLYSLNNHILYKHTPKEKQIEKIMNCLHCEYKTLHKTSLKRHILVKHTPDSEINWQQCPHCDRKFKYLFLLRSHIRNNHASRVKCPHCEFFAKPNRSLRNHILQNHAKDDEKIGKLFSCAKCGYTISCKWKLKQHIYNQHSLDSEIKWYQCPQCTYKGKRVCYLKKHIVLNHPIEKKPEKSYKCSECEFKSVRKPSLTQHILYKHTPESEGKWYQCSYCNYKSIYPSVLKRHMIGKKHSSKSEHGKDAKYIGKYFQCIHCDYKAVFKSQFNRHNLSKHTRFDENMDQMYHCSMCDYKTIKKSDLLKHISRKKHATKYEIDEPILQQSH